MNRKPVIATVAAILVLATVFWFYRRAEARDGAAYRTDTIERGDIYSTVAATGALSAVTTVQVGTQVSGQVSAIYVDFNDRVKKGQLVARIDPTLQQQAVAEAEAGLERARAELRQAEQNYERNKQLYDRKVITDTEFTAIEYQRSVSRANLKSAEISLDRAQRNLGYTSIYAPIDGIVVERNVDVGQTVAASLSAPQLFLIAQDLEQMQILANVDESDIGLIHEGQTVRFTVQTYPDERFTGTVEQVRLQSTTTENVVNYTVAVKVENPDGRLLPGMTATVDFVTASAEDVLKVPNAALRFRPTGMPGADTPGARGGQSSGGANGAANGARAGGGR
ncbi:MAG TPA: efflux RND transporter periplasmic adaptor subunit, partial [Gemmatimonadales bacterium]